MCCLIDELLERKEALCTSKLVEKHKPKDDDVTDTTWQTQERHSNLASRILHVECAKDAQHRMVVVNSFLQQHRTALLRASIQPSKSFTASSMPQPPSEAATNFSGLVFVSRCVKAQQVPFWSRYPHRRLENPPMCRHT